MNFLKNNVFSLFFSLLENHDSHLSGHMEVKLEKLGKMCSNKKDASFNVLQFLYPGIFSVGATVKAL